MKRFVQDGTRADLDAKLDRLSHFSNPPMDVVSDALAAYGAHVLALEAEITRLDARVGEEVSFQRHIREQEAERRGEQYTRHINEKRRLVKELGFAAVIRDRVMTAHGQGRKTVKIESLLEGRPADGEA